VLWHDGAIVSAWCLGFLATALLLAGELAPAGAPPGPPAFALHWSAPADCPDGSHIRSDVLRLAGADARRSHQLKAQAVIRPDEHEGWTLDLRTELDGIAGERNLAGASCQSLSEAATLTLALLLNPEAKIEAAPEPTPPPSAKKVIVPPDTPTAERTWPQPVWHVGALAGLQVGVLSEPSPWFGLSLGVALNRFSLRLVPGFTPPQNLSSQSRSGAGGRLWLVSGSALGCFAALEKQVTLIPCLGVNLVRLHGKGWGMRDVHEASVYWTSAELALLAALPLGRVVRLELWGLGLLPLYKSSVYLDEAGLVSRPASFGFGARAGFSLAWR
jgi:hypothetical protein